MKKMFMILFAGLLVSAGLSAQKVYLDGTKVILDLTETTGMPAGAVTDESKTALYADATPKGNDTIKNNTNNAAINARVFQKLEVAPKDMNTSRGMNGTGTMEMTWAEAFNGCIKSTYNGGSWRLPTQREMMLVWIFRDAMEALGDSFLSTALYWCATETNASSAAYVNFNPGANNPNATKTYLHRVRCVREVTP
jgi:hypothetical protein